MAEPRVNRDTEGVEFEFLANGVPMKAHVSREALRDHCGVGEKPEGWLAAFRAHESRISERPRTQNF